MFGPVDAPNERCLGSNVAWRSRNTPTWTQSRRVGGMLVVASPRPGLPRWLAFHRALEAQPISSAPKLGRSRSPGQFADGLSDCRKRCSGMGPTQLPCGMLNREDRPHPSPRYGRHGVAVYSGTGGTPSTTWVAPGPGTDRSVSTYLVPPAIMRGPAPESIGIRVALTRRKDSGGFARPAGGGPPTRPSPRFRPKPTNRGRPEYG